MKRRNRTTRDATITVRVTEKERAAIKEKATKKSKSASEYMLDSAMAGMERRRNKDKKRIARMVKQQQTLSEIFRLMEGTGITGELYGKVKELAEGENELWQYL